MKNRLNIKAFITMLLVATALVSVLCACDSIREPTPIVTIKPTEHAIAVPTPIPTLAPTTEPTLPPTQAPTPTPVEIVSDEPITVNFFPPSSTQTAQMLNMSIAIQFHATAPFNEITLTCPSWADSIGTLDFDLYKWIGNYDDSVEGTAVASQTFENYPDNADNKMQFEELPAGEYILYLSTPNSGEGVGVWTIPTEYDKVAVYLEDVYFEEFAINHFKVSYTKTPAVLQGDITPEY